MKIKLNVLVNCERSGEVREAFRRRGHNAYSCDVEDADDHSPYHIKGDAIRAALDGHPVTRKPWDLMIGHPPCTYLCNSGVCWLSTRIGTRTKMHWSILDAVKRRVLMKAGAKFFRDLWEMDDIIPHIALENPIPHGYAVERIGCKYNQLIQPWMFGHMEQKATCLWLKGLPPLKETNNVKAAMMLLPRNVRMRLHYQSPSKDRARIRSKTFRGIAEAMAEQWSEYILREHENNKMHTPTARHMLNVQTRD